MLKLELFKGKLLNLVWAFSWQQRRLRVMQQACRSPERQDM